MQTACPAASSQGSACPSPLQVRAPALECGASLSSPKTNEVYERVSRTNRDGAAEEVFRLLTEPVGETARASASLLTSLGICTARHRLPRSPLFWLGGVFISLPLSLFSFFFFVFNLEYLAGASGAAPPRGVRKAGRMSVGQSVGGRSV